MSQDEKEIGIFRFGHNQRCYENDPSLSDIGVAESIERTFDSVAHLPRSAYAEKIHKINKEHIKIELAHGYTTGSPGMRIDVQRGRALQLDNDNVLRLSSLRKIVDFFYDDDDDETMIMEGTMTLHGREEEIVVKRKDAFVTLTK